MGILHGTPEVNLTFGTGGNEQVASCLMDLSQTIDLKGLAKGIATYPSAIATTEGRWAMLRHLPGALDLESMDQFSRKVKTAFQASQTTGSLKGDPSIQPFESNSSPVDFPFEKFEEMSDFDTQLDTLAGVIARQGPVTLRTGCDDFLDARFCDRFEI